MLNSNDTSARLVPVVYVIDDDDGMRTALATLFDSLNMPTELFASADEFILKLDAIENLPPVDLKNRSERDATGYDSKLNKLNGCIVSDVRMPGLSGIGLQTELGRRNCMLPIIFITGHGDIPMAVEAMQTGAVNFLQKPFREQELLDSIEAAFQKIARNITPAYALQLRQTEQQLTPRELEVLQQLLTGKAGKLIADELNISAKTVDVHRSKILRKFSVPSIQRLLALYAQKSPETTIESST